MENKKQYNAKKTNKRREQSELASDSNSNNKANIQTDIILTGDEPKRTTGNMGKGNSTSIGAKVIGGILNRLRNLKKMHLEYVDAHGERLEKRLAENHSHKAKISTEMDNFERELVHLLEESSSQDGSEES